jgi:hypothetical protein
MKDAGHFIAAEYSAKPFQLHGFINRETGKDEPIPINIIAV